MEWECSFMVERDVTPPNTHEVGPAPLDADGPDFAEGADGFDEEEDGGELQG